MLKNGPPISARSKIPRYDGEWQRLQREKQKWAKKDKGRERISFLCEMPERFIGQLHIITKYSGKLDCLVKEMLYIRRMRKSTLNVHTDSIRAKVFV